MRVLVCGGRDYADRRHAYDVLNEYAQTITVLINGSAMGADQLAIDWIWDAGLAGSVLIHRYPANWKKYGKSAGPMRNQQMIDEGKPDIVVAFPGGRGTADMVRRAELAGIKVARIEKVAA